ncbi:MAG: RNA-binding transcriptional accessory protein [Clostridia bacterium]|nr:RNA-binding transcriptional accessory protein [Clostridia bacterium]
MDNIQQQLMQELNLKEFQVKNTIDLIDGGNTIPFIARYRKEVTGGMSDEVLRDFYDRLTYLRNLNARKEEIIRLIDEQGKLTDELKEKILLAKIMTELEDLYRPYKQKKRTRATIAKEKGLEPLANIIYLQKTTTGTREEIAARFINKEKGVETVEDAINGALDIIAETISDNAEYRKDIRKMTFDNALIVSKAVNPDEKTVYDMYYDFSEPICKVPSHRILAMNRGEKEDKLKIKVDVDTDNILKYLTNNVITGESIFKNDIELAISDAYKRLIAPSIENEIRGMVTEEADEKAIKVFGVNVKNLLMQAPLKNKVVMGFDPAYRTGCKIAVIDETGKVLATTTVYPTEPQNDVIGAKKELTNLIKKFKINMIAIGNGTASRESEQFVADMLKEIDDKVYYTIVSEAGASVYSASKLATEEYPDINVSLRGAISIARRLQDPMAEFVKIDPKSIGVGQYQHDVNQKRLDETLTGVVEDAVNRVGVDLNTATPSLLNYVSGISKTIANNIVKYREEKGKFKSRKELLKVAKLGPSAFTQCSGFLRIPGATNPLDNTAVHPESYEIAEKVLNKIGYKVEDLVTIDKNELLRKVNAIKPEEMAKELDIGVPTLVDILNELKKPGRDVRDEMPKPILRSDVLKIDDLREGMELTGTVRNVIDFGAFVDIGIKNDGLVHISELSDKFVKNPMDIVSVGDIVKVKVIKIDLDKGKVGLSMKGL